MKGARWWSSMTRAEVCQRNNGNSMQMCGSFPRIALIEALRATRARRLQQEDIFISWMMMTGCYPARLTHSGKRRGILQLPGFTVHFDWWTIQARRLLMFFPRKRGIVMSILSRGNG